jgi:hypothetical protein
VSDLPVSSIIAEVHPKLLDNAARSLIAGVCLERLRHDLERTLVTRRRSRSFR